MWLTVGKCRGIVQTCGMPYDKKPVYENEYQANRIANKYNIDALANPDDPKRVRYTSYPCCYCDKWHVGKALTPREEARYLVLSLGIATDEIATYHSVY